MQLKEYLEETGITGMFFSKKVGVKESAIYAYATKRSTPPLKVLARIIECTNGKVSLEDFLGRELDFKYKRFKKGITKED